MNLETARDALPKCTVCKSPATLFFLEDESGEVLRCVACATDRNGSHDERERAAEVDRDYCAGHTFARRDLRADLRAAIARDAERARALFRSAKRPIPKWLYRMDPVAALREAPSERERKRLWRS